jgi:vacuolar-type H+-ATPase subunit H
VIRSQDFEQVIERMRINVPSSIRESERTVAERDRIIAEAKGEAERIVQQARQEAVDILSERSLITTAQQEAGRIVDEGKEIARQRIREADRYAVHALHELSDHLQAVMREVENGIEIMQVDRRIPSEGVGHPPEQPPNP